MKKRFSSKCDSHLKRVNVGNLVQCTYVQGDTEKYTFGLYIRVLLLYNFYKRVFEFICMTKKGVMVFLFYFKTRQKSSLFQLLPNIQLWCLIA